MVMANEQGEGGGSADKSWEKVLRESGHWNDVGRGLCAVGAAFLIGSRLAWRARSTWGYRITNFFMWPTLGVGATLLVWNDATQWRDKHDSGASAMTPEELEQVQELNQLRFEVLRRVIQKEREKK